MDAEQANTGEVDPWVAAMRRGDFSRACEISDAILRERQASGATCYDWPRHLQYVWTGAPLAGKRVLVRCYHGLGDTIQFIRFAAPLRRIAREVLVWVQPPFVDLMAGAAGVDRVLPLHDGAPEADYDVDIEIMELMHALRADEKLIRCGVPYLWPPALARMAGSLPSGPRVGIVWQAGEWDARRSLPAALVAELQSRLHFPLLSLQLDAGADAAAIGALDVSTADINRLACLIAELDLVISVDTMVAHLAGALGVPVWTMLRADCDWRWMQQETQSVWYPTMRLFRQAQDGIWQSIIPSIAAALRTRFPTSQTGASSREQVSLLT
jgi:Glycosyltransferase family 9 (heptosyltransferase)